MNFSEPEHLSQLRDTLRRFVEQKMPRPLAAKWDRDNHFPRDVFARLAEIGVMGLTISEEHGGVVRDIAATMMVIEELSRRSLAVSVPYIMAACYGGMNIAEFGTEAQKASILPAIARGELIVAYGLTEPDAGADLASVRTRVERHGDRLILTGEKRFCSGANIADYIYVLARSGDAADRHRNLSFVLVPPSAQGVEVTIIDAMGMKGAATTDVVMRDVEVPFENLVGGEAAWNQGWPMLVGTGLDVWLVANGIRRVIVSGIRTEQCCETTTRQASDLGYTVDFVGEATLTFPMTDATGREWSAAEIRARTELVLANRFARIATVEEALAGQQERKAA